MFHGKSLSKTRLYTFQGRKILSREKYVICIQDKENNNTPTSFNVNKWFILIFIKTIIFDFFDKSGDYSSQIPALIYTWIYEAFTLSFDALDKKTFSLTT